MSEEKTQAVVVYGCHCDCFDGKPDACVLDLGTPEDCVHTHRGDVKKKESCQYWRPIAFVPAAASPDVLVERERCAAQLELTPPQILLMAGEMTGQEMRTVQAVLRNRAKVIRDPDLYDKKATGLPARPAGGVLIGRNDKHGRPIHIGDTLRFDPREWGGECEFVIELTDGQISHPGTSDDLDQWCEIVRYWDGSEPTL